MKRWGDIGSTPPGRDRIIWALVFALLIASLILYHYSR